MAGQPGATRDLDELTEQELEALLEGAAWYAKYHERGLAASSDDPSHGAHARRQQFGHLHSALSKLGVRLRRPQWLDAA